jgi:hypothetical protein
VVGMKITGDIVATGENSKVLEWFADRLMVALTEKDSVIDPTIGGSFALGTLQVTFDIKVGSAAEGYTRGPQLLLDAVQEAGMRPTHEWTDVPGVTLHGEFAYADDALMDELHRLVSGQQLLRSVRSDLLCPRLDPPCCEGSFAPVGR